MTGGPPAPATIPGSAAGRCRISHGHHYHNHHHNHGHNHGPSAASGIRLAFALNLSFAVAEFGGGLWSNSLAITADALHDLGDSLALGLSWYFLKLSERGRTAEFSYGYRRFSLLGALLNCVILVAGSAWILYEAVGRLGEPVQPNAPLMLAFAVVGLAVNGFAAWRLHDEGGLTAESVRWHLIEDVLGWAVVLVGAAVMTVADVPIIDPLLSIGIMLFVLWNVLRTLRKVAVVFLQAVPEGLDANELERQIVALPGVQAAHHTHVWSLDGEHHVLTTHVVLDPAASRPDIVEVKRQIRALIDDRKIGHLTVEVELEGEICGMDTPGRDEAMMG
jgi:cobalt-zinc-cadmium efflux system protein